MIMTYPFLLLMPRNTMAGENIYIFLECAGLFTNAEKAKGHFSNNVKKF